MKNQKQSETLQTFSKTKNKCREIALDLILTRFLKNSISIDSSDSSKMTRTDAEDAISKEIKVASDAIHKLFNA